MNPEQLTADDYNQAAGFGEDDDAPETPAPAPALPSPIDNLIARTDRQVQAKMMRDQADELDKLARYAGDQARFIGKDNRLLASRFEAAARANKKLAVAIREQAEKVWPKRLVGMVPQAV